MSFGLEEVVNSEFEIRQDLTKENVIFTWEDDNHCTIET